MIYLAKGDSYAFGIGRASNGVAVDLSSYTCDLAVIKSSDLSATGIDRSVTLRSSDNLKFLVNLTSAETATLSQNAEYIVAYRLSDVATAYVKESSFKIKIIDSYFD